MELFRFIKEYLSSPKAVGGLAPSSHRLAELVTDAAKVAEAERVVEFGPGTGVFTEVIARKMKEGGEFFALEVSEEFVHAVRERCPGVKVFHDSAANCRKYMDELGVASCDCIVSGLPFALFEDGLQNDLLDAAYDALRPGGVFVTFTYIMSPFTPRGRRFAGKLYGCFGDVTRTRVEWLNFLPAFAYVCRKVDA